jgi:hypothetical protein
MSLQCAPGKEYVDGSCISLFLLLKMIDAYNKSNSNNIINIIENFNYIESDINEKVLNDILLQFCKLNVSSIKEEIKIYEKKKDYVTNASHKKINLIILLNKIIKTYKIYLLDELKKKLYSECDNNQMCWIKQSFINNMDELSKNELLNYTFRPIGPGPQGNFEWLNTLNINYVLEQYKKKYKDFEFLGAVPMDFANPHVSNISDINFNNLVNSGKTKIGVIFNLDTSNQSGSHWVALYTNLLKNQIYYFDSTSYKPDNRVIDLINKIKMFMNTQNNLDIDYRINKTKHQMGSSECGVYSINFILRMLKGDTFDNILNKRISDNTVNKCRKKYFNYQK